MWVACLKMQSSTDVFVPRKSFLEALNLSEIRASKGGRGQVGAGLRKPEERTRIAISEGRSLADKGGGYVDKNGKTIVRVANNAESQN